MPFTLQRLVLVMSFGLAASSIQFAHAQESVEHVFGRSGITELTGSINRDNVLHRLPTDAPVEFYLAEHTNTRNGQRLALAVDAAVKSLLESDKLTPWDRYELANIGEYLNNLAPGRVAQALEQLAGSQNANLAAATRMSTQQVSDTLLSVLRDLPANVADDAEGRLWVKGLSHNGTLDGQYGSVGLQQSTKGVVLGADWAVDHAWRAGVVGGKSESEFEHKRFKAALDSWHLGAYAVRQDGPLALRLGAIYSNHDGQNKRGVDIDFVGYREQLKGKYTAQSQTVFGEMGYQLGKDTLSVEPFAGLGYQRYHREGFKEKGGFAALNVGAQTQQNLSSTLGLRLGSLYRFDNNMSLSPHLSTHWKHLYGDVQSSVKQSSRLIDLTGEKSDFTVDGVSLNRDSLALRTGLDIGLSAHQAVSVAYTTEVGSNSRNHGLVGEWKMGF